MSTKKITTVQAFEVYTYMKENPSLFQHVGKDAAADIIEEKFHVRPSGTFLATGKIKEITGVDLNMRGSRRPTECLTKDDTVLVLCAIRELHEKLGEENTTRAAQIRDLHRKYSS
jgi:hypothetical protein